MLLTIETKEVAPDITVLTFAGKITIGRESARIETLVQDLLARNKRKLVFDLSGVGYIDSTGLGIVTFCSAAVNEAGGALRVAGVQPLPEKLFQITKLDKIVRFFPSVTEACQEFTLAAPGK
jgi:anti-anti-sigma factor